MLSRAHACLPQASHPGRAMEWRLDGTPWAQRRARYRVTPITSCWACHRWHEVARPERSAGRGEATTPFAALRDVPPWRTAFKAGWIQARPTPGTTSPSPVPSSASDQGRCEFRLRLDLGDGWHACHPTPSL